MLYRVVEDYVVHDIADGFIPNTFRQEVGSPGSAVAFYPETRYVVFIVVAVVVVVF